MLTWYNALAGNKSKANQGDVTAPIITSTDTMPPSVYGPFEYDIHVVENSYAETSTGLGMAVSFV